MPKKTITGILLIALTLSLLMLALSSAKANGLVGDVNGDGKVDITDLYEAALAFGSTKGSSRYNSDADINSDDRVDMNDLYTIVSHLGDT